MTLGQKLKLLLKDNGMTQEDLAERLDGYLSYSRHTVNQIVGGISLFILSNVFDCFGQHGAVMSILYWITMAAGIIIIIWHFLQTRQYQEIKNEYLTFDDKVFEAFKKQRESRRKKYAVTVAAALIGVITNAWSPYAPIIILFCCLLVTTCKLLIESRGER